MMINKRLIKTIPNSMNSIIKNVIFQWIGLLCNISIVMVIGYMITNFVVTLGLLMTLLAAIIIRLICTYMSGKQSYESSQRVKSILRQLIFDKLLRMGSRYQDNMTTAELVQIGVEGVEQLEVYFSSYLPQLFYSLLAPLTLFVVIAFIDLKAALVLLVCVPLIPISIILVQKFAKKLLEKYWGQYTALGDNFLENLQGLATLKIFEADEAKHKEMNKEAEHFRKITMKVLTMQLNSITIMDLIAYGGAAVGIIVAMTQVMNGNISVYGGFVIILLAADFFIPLRLLGSFFHIAMNGMAASEKIFKFLDMEEVEDKEKQVGSDKSISLRDVNFSYDNKRDVLKNINMEFKENSFISIVGESGSGKSTVASLIMSEIVATAGEVKIGKDNISDLNMKSKMKTITKIGIKAYLFKGTVRENLLMGNPNATDKDMWDALKKVNLYDFMKGENGLDTMLLEKGSNLSGGQCQRLAIARALLHDSSIYIFDEATSNIDVESENSIIELLKSLKSTKTIILISHRLMNAVDSDHIYVLEKGKCMEEGTHKELLNNKNIYSGLWNAQMKLEQFAGGDA